MFKRKILLAAIILSVSTTTLARQIEKGDVVVGAAVGAGWYGATFGGAAEIGIKDDINEAMTFSAGAMGAYSSYTRGWSNNDWKFSHTAIAGMLNANFYKPEWGGLQPYAGLNLGYNFISVDSGYLGSWGSGIWMGAHIGSRYYFSDEMAVNVRLGYPVATIGIDFRF